MERKRKTRLIVAVPAAFLLLVVLVVFGLRSAPEKSLLKIMADKVDLQIQSVRYTDVGETGMKWEIHADTARYLKRENLALFEKITVRLLMKDGRTFVMNGDQGRLDTRSRDIEINGNVDIVSENGDRLATDRLRYISASKRVETDRPVTMQNRDVRIRGVGMILELEESRLTLLSQIRAVTGGKKQGN